MNATTPELTIDLQLAMKTAASELAREFGGDPAGLGVAAVRPIRDEIERRVPSRRLLAELGVRTT